MESFEAFCKKNYKGEDRSMSFNKYLFKLMREKNIEGPSLYNKVNMTRQTYSKILSDQMEPSLTNAVKLAIALKCTNTECKTLLKKLGYTLSSSSKFALVIRYCLENKIYDYYKVNDLLMKYGCNPLDK